jgi:hypothetical protein
MDQQRTWMGEEPAQGEQFEQETGIDDQHLLRCAGAGQISGNVPDADLRKLAAQAFVRIQLPEAAWRRAHNERRRGRGRRYLHLRLADQSSMGLVQSCRLTVRVSSIGGAQWAGTP